MTTFRDEIERLGLSNERAAPLLQTVVQNCRNWYDGHMTPPADVMAKLKAMPAPTK